MRHEPTGTGPSAARLAAFSGELAEALRAHRLWLDRINHNLVCRSAPHPEDRGAHAHLRCRFGRWYRAARLPRGLPAEVAAMLAEIGSVHRGMHEQARRLLALARAGPAPLPEPDYSRFAKTVRELGRRIEMLGVSLNERFFALDPLTGIYGRQVMDADLRQMRAELVAERRPACLAMADLDFFKSVNDTHGHAAGDHVLREVARLFVRLLRPYDQVYRYGGEEFLIALPDTRPAAARRILGRLRRALAATPIGYAPGETLRMTASFGLAEVSPDAPLAEVIRLADRALYDAKAAGRNRVVAAD